MFINIYIFIYNYIHIIVYSPVKKKKVPTRPLVIVHIDLIHGYYAALPLSFPSRLPLTLPSLCLSFSSHLPLTIVSLPLILLSFAPHSPLVCPS